MKVGRCRRRSQIRFRRVLLLMCLVRSDLRWLCDDMILLFDVDDLI
jgi:hypothetical protein